MHIYFSGIGGAGIGPLAMIAKQAGFTVSGSDKQDSQYIHYLKKQGLTDIHIGQTLEQIKAVHKIQPIDWLVYSTAVTLENPHSAEIEFAHTLKIKVTKRDELLNLIIEKHHLKLIAVAGTHGKTTTTAMLVWLFKQLQRPISYALPAKVSFGEMGQLDQNSQFFIYEADEFDRNFLAFKPYMSLISGVSYDHHEIFPTREDYQAAFREFISQSAHSLLWQEDYDYLSLEAPTNLSLLDASNPLIDLIKLKGRYNRLDGWLVVQALSRLTKTSIPELMRSLNRFPGLQRRMEQIKTNLFSDYAHTPEKIRGAMSVALEMAEAKNQAVIIVYEPLTNRRQHYIAKDYGDCFNGAAKLYWLPSYLAREDPSQAILSPAELISHLSDPALAEPAKRNQQLKETIKAHLEKGDMVVGLSGGGGDSLDEWLRANFS